MLSYQCFDLEELQTKLADILAGRLTPANGEERDILINQYLAALKGPLACERMIDVLEEVVQGNDELPRPPVRDRLSGRLMSAVRTLIKRGKEHIPGSHNRPEFQRHRYPGISLEDIQARLSRFQQVLGDSRELKVGQRSQQFFEISG